MEILNHAKQILKDEQITFEKLKEEYKYLIEKYEKLLKEVVKITNISDIQGNYLHKLKDELLISNKKLKNLSERDKLTNLYNRLKFDKVISQEIEYAKRYNRIFSLVLCDIDYFKNINDTYGHNFGDEVLVAFSKLLIQNLRKIDYVFRWGGDEFIILLPETNKFEAHKVAEKLKRKILQDKFLKKINLTASFGVEEYKKGLSIDEVIELADKALYKSKENGRNMIS